MYFIVWKNSTDMISATLQHDVGWLQFKNRQLGNSLHHDPVLSRATQISHKEGDFSFMNGERSNLEFSWEVANSSYYTEHSASV